MSESAEPVALHPALIETLQANRESLNARFALRQRAGARIDERALHEHLRTHVNRLVAEVAKSRPERVRMMVDSLFDVSLDLFAAGLLGPEPRHPHVATAWRDVLPRAAPLLAIDPILVAGCLSNAVDYLSTQSSARPAEWIRSMSELSAQCDSVRQWLDVGKVAAWRAGMVAFRSAALAIARTLPWRLAACCVGADEGQGETAWREWLDHAATDPWLPPPGCSSKHSKDQLRLVGAVGEFRGFGGAFLNPPVVSLHEGALHVTDGDTVWHLSADRFGTCWQRAAQTSGKPTSKVAASGNVNVDHRGKIRWDDRNCQFAELAEPRSFACDGQTLAVTLPTSFHVFLVARVLH